MKFETKILKMKISKYINIIRKKVVLQLALQFNF